MRSWADPFTSVAATLSITTSAATTAILHRGIFAAFLHLTEFPRKGQKSVRNQSETSQKPAKRNLSLSLSPLAYSLTLLPELLRLLLFQFPLPLLLLLLLVLLVLL